MHAGRRAVEQAGQVGEGWVGTHLSVTSVTPFLLATASTLAGPSEGLYPLSMLEGEGLRPPAGLSPVPVLLGVTPLRPPWPCMAGLLLPPTAHMAPPSLASLLKITLLLPPEIDSGEGGRWLGIAVKPGVTRGPTALVGEDWPGWALACTPLMTALLDSLPLRL